MAVSLGCAQSMSVVVREKGAVGQVTPLIDVLSAEWTRVLDNISEATVTVSARGRGCCEVLSGVRPWSHELALFRESEPVWEGPIYTVRDDRREGTVTFEAHDVLAWLTKRRIHSSYDYTGNPIDLADIAHRIIRDGLGVDDPDVMRFVTVTQTGVLAERAADANSTLVWDELSEMARVGLDITTVGRRILVFPETQPLAYIGVLNDSHFVEGVPLEWLGSATVNDMWLIGDGVTGNYASPPGRFGVLEGIMKTEGVLDTLSANVAARLVVQRLAAPPLVIFGGDFGELKPRAPVTISQLVPGVHATLQARGNCETVVQDMRLELLRVEWEPGSEKITPGWTPADTINERR